MNKFYKLLIFIIFSFSFAHAEEEAPYKVTLEYKAYWAGFVVANISSETTIYPNKYEVTAHYKVSGVASIFSNSENNTMSRGILHTSGEYRPNEYKSTGHFGDFEYLNHAYFDPDSLKVIDHTQELKLRKDTEYIPIPEEEKFGSDPITIFLNMIMKKDFNNAFSETQKHRQFGGIFVSEQTYICDDQELMKHESRSVFEGQATICSFDGEMIAGNIKSTKKNKKRKKDRVDDDQKTRLWFGKMDGFDAMIPVYTEFPIGWGKVRVYLSGYQKEPVEPDLIKAENIN